MSHPTSDEIQVVRYRLGKLGTGNTSKISNAMITEFWREIQEEVIVDTGIGSYTSGNYLQRGCIADGTAMMVLGAIVGDTFQAKNIRLGDFFVEDQGLNWNVGVFAAGKEYFGERYERRLVMLSTAKFGLTTEIGSDYSEDIHTSLDTIANDAGLVW